MGWFFFVPKKRTDTRSSSVMSQIMGAANLTLHRWEELNAVPPYPAPQKQRVCVLMFHCVFPLLPKSCRSTQNPMCVCFVVVRGCQRGRGRNTGWMDPMFNSILILFLGTWKQNKKKILNRDFSNCSFQSLFFCFKKSKLFLACWWIQIQFCTIPTMTIVRTLSNITTGITTTYSAIVNISIKWIICSRWIILCSN